MRRVTLCWPRRGSWRLWLQVIFEREVLSYSLTLLPFVAAVLIWRDYAVAIAQAPILMLMVIYVVESRLMRLNPDKRRALVSDVEAEAGLDTLRARARSLLGRIAAQLGQRHGNEGVAGL